MSSDTVNYSVRIDANLRDQMRDIPDMAEKIREFIRREVEYARGSDSDSPEEQFIRNQLAKHGLVGAYCLLQLTHRAGDKYYLDNVKERFPDDNEAQLTAKRIRDEWDECNVSSLDARKVIEDVFAEETHKDEDWTPTHASYLDRLMTHAIERIDEKEELEEQVYWTAWQLGLARAERHSGSLEGGVTMERRSFSQTLDAAFDADEDTIENAINSLAALGATQSHTYTNSYIYDNVRLPEFLIDAFEAALSEEERNVRDRVRDYAENDPYIERIQAITQDDELEERHNPQDYLYRNRQRVGDDDVMERYGDKLSDLIKDGAVVIQYSTGRRAKSGRGATSSDRIYVLAPAVRQVIGDAIYKRQATG